MITCHLINVLKAFQSPLQDKSQNWKCKNKCMRRLKTWTHTSTSIFILHRAMSLSVIRGCSYEYALFVHIEMQYKRRMPVLPTDGKTAEVGGWRGKDLMPVAYITFQVKCASV